MQQIKHQRDTPKQRTLERKEKWLQVDKKKVFILQTKQQNYNLMVAEMKADIKALTNKIYFKLIFKLRKYPKSMYEIEC